MISKLNFFRSSVLATVLSVLVIGNAHARNMPCLDNNKRPLPVMNEQVIRWKGQTPNQYKDRALIAGVVTRVTLSRSSHEQFEIKIGPNRNDTIEVIYNVEFGELPQIREGMQVEACGDYITSNAPAGNYKASPSGAIIHWVHYNPGDRDGGRHPHGFVKIDGVLYGQSAPDTGRNGERERNRDRNRGRNRLVVLDEVSTF